MEELIIIIVAVAKLTDRWNSMEKKKKKYRQRKKTKEPNKLDLIKKLIR